MRSVRIMISTGIDELDEILRGGFEEGALVLIIGEPGMGKSVLAVQCAIHNAKVGNKVLYLSTIKSSEKKKRYIEKIIGKPADKIDNLEIKDTNLIDTSDAHNQMGIKKLFTNDYKIGIIDNIAGLLPLEEGMKIDDALLKLHTLMLDLQRVSDESGMVLVAIHSSSKDSSKGVVSHLADSIIELGEEEKGNICHRVLRVKKHDNYVENKAHPFLIDEKGNFKMRQSIWI